MNPRRVARLTGRLLLTLLAAILSMASTKRAHAAEGGDAEVWAGAFVQASPTAKPTGPRFWLDVQDRRSSSGTVVLARPGLGWQVTPWMSVWAGYAWVPTFPDEGELSQEHRAWEQVQFNLTEGPFSYSLRLREEQRVRVGEPGLSHRLRAAPRVGVQISRAVSMQVWDELFVAWNQTDWFPVRGLDQNRAFVGPAFHGGPRVRMELGYLRQDLFRGEASVTNHIVATNLFVAIAPP